MNGVIPYFGTGGTQVVGAYRGEPPVRANAMDRLHQLGRVHIAGKLSGQEHDMFCGFILHALP